MKFCLQPGPIDGGFVRLELFADALKADVEAVLSAPDPAWALMATSAQGARFDGWWAIAMQDMAAGRRIAYAVRRRADEAVVGVTSFLNIDVASAGVEIGSSFLAPHARAGAINPEMKRLMLDHAFEAGAIRVELRTDARNLRSQAAIAKLGAVREGVLRRQKRLWNGELRDTVVYSILAQEWPAVRAGLDARLSRWAAPHAAL